MIWDEPFRLLQLNLRLIDAKDLNVRQMVDEIASYGATAILANAGGIMAWYPTRLSHQRQVPHLATDFLGEVTEACHRRGISVLARLDITKGHVEDFERHPDWFRIAADGNPVIVRELVETCFSGPYWQRFNFEMLDEILEQYPVDGIFYNHFRYLTCYCARCRSRFTETTGLALPVAEDWNDNAWRALVSYRYQALADYAKRVRTRVREQRPEAIVCWDYELATDNPPYARDSGWGPPLTSQADVIASIAFNRLTRPLPKWIYQPGEQASLGRASFRKPTCVILTYSAIFGNRRHAQPPDQLGRDIIQIAARGGAPGVALSGTFSQDDRKALPVLRHVYHFLKRHTDLYHDLRSEAEGAIVYSQRTADWYGRADAVSRYLTHYRGCYEALVHEHIPFEVLDLESHPGALARYRVVVLPNVACMTEETAATLDAFVQNGGHLIATHETSLYDAQGQPLKTFALRSLGRQFVKRRLMQGTYLLAKDRGLLGPVFHETGLIGLGLERPYGGFGPFVPQVDVDAPGGEGEFIFTTGTGQEDLLLSNPVTNNVPEFSYWEGEIGTPGLTINRFGAGTASLLPWGVGRLYHTYGLPECRSLLGRLVDLALGPRRLRTDAPLSVETILGSSRNRTVVHLINSTGLESKPLLEAVPVGPITLSVRGVATRATSLTDGTPLPVTREGDEVKVVISRLGLFGVVVIE